MPTIKKPRTYSFSLIDKNTLKKISDLHDIKKTIALPFIGLDKYITSLNIKSETTEKSIIKSDDGLLFVKKIPWYCSTKEHTETITKFQEYLGDHNLSLVTPTKNKDGRLFCHIEDEYYICTKYLPDTRYNKKISTARNIGKYIADMHNISKTFPVNKEICNSDTIHNSTENAINLLEDDDDKRRLVEILNSLKFPNYNDMAILNHGDLNPSNFIFKEDEVLSIIDFDNIVYDNPIRDLAEAILTLSIVDYKEGTSSVKHINTIPDTKIIKALLESYSETAPNTYNKIKHLLIPACTAIHIELYCIGLARKDINTDKIFEYNQNTYKKIQSIANSVGSAKGIHIVDTFNEIVNTDLLHNFEKVKDYISEAITKTGMSVIDTGHHNFNPGYTCFFLLEESHLSLHTWPEKESLQIDIFVCNYNNDNTHKAKTIYKELKEYFGTGKNSIKTIIRD